jgi:hypothetical protein
MELAPTYQPRQFVTRFKLFKADNTLGFLTLVVNTILLCCGVRKHAACSMAVSVGRATRTGAAHTTSTLDRQTGRRLSSRTQLRARCWRRRVVRDAVLDVLRALRIVAIWTFGGQLQSADGTFVFLGDLASRVLALGWLGGVEEGVRRGPCLGLSVGMGYAAITAGRYWAALMLGCVCMSGWVKSWPPVLRLRRLVVANHSPATDSLAWAVSLVGGWIVHTGRRSVGALRRMVGVCRCAGRGASWSGLGVRER